MEIPHLGRTVFVLRRGFEVMWIVWEKPSPASCAWCVYVKHQQDINSTVLFLEHMMQNGNECVSETMGDDKMLSEAVNQAFI